MALEILRMPYQQKAFHCYLMLSIWILLLIAGIYKFLEPKPKLIEPSSALVNSADLFENLQFDIKTKKIFQLCNLPQEIISGDEGIFDTKQWTMKGLLILIRHGDRGPLQHVRNISGVNCGTTENDLLHSYKTYMHNITVSGKISWIGPGPFHGFPLLPTHLTKCQLGQLTMQGVAQLLTLGSLLRKNYNYVWPKLSNITSSEIVVYSTRYRRTFQSILSFLYGFIPTDTLAKLNIIESQSMSFCFKDCGCPVTDKYLKFVKKSISNQLKSHPAVSMLAESTGKSILTPRAEQGTFASDPHAVRDSLLTYVCHGSGLPCEKPNNCVKRQNVAGIFAYTDWVNYQKWKNSYWKKFCSLRSYGLIKHLVSQMLHMISSNGPYLVIYSGHDHTIEQISTALGLKNDPLLLRYGSRIIFEVYHDNKEDTNSVRGLHFRLLANGKDVTKQINFCKELVELDTKISLCKFEDIVRFIHDDYFSKMNVTNFKDACLIQTVDY